MFNSLGRESPFTHFQRNKEYRLRFQKLFFMLKTDYDLTIYHITPSRVLKLFGYDINETSFFGFFWGRGIFCNLIQHRCNSLNLLVSHIIININDFYRKKNSIFLGIYLNKFPFYFLELSL